MQRHPFAFQILQLIGSLDSLAKPRVPNYPPMDIIRIDAHTVELQFAVAGFAQSDITITTEQNVLRIQGSAPESHEVEYLAKGIARRSFDHKFDLPPHSEVVSATYDSGLLKVKVQTVIPESQKLKTISIG